MTEDSFKELALSESTASTPKTPKQSEAAKDNEQPSTSSASLNTPENNRAAAKKRAERREKVMKFIRSFGKNGEQFSKLKRKYTNLLRLVNLFLIFEFNFVSFCFILGIYECLFDEALDFELLIHLILSKQILIDYTAQTLYAANESA